LNDSVAKNTWFAIEVGTNSWSSSASGDAAKKLHFETFAFEAFLKQETNAKLANKKKKNAA